MYTLSTVSACVDGFLASGSEGRDKGMDQATGSFLQPFFLINKLELSMRLYQYFDILRLVEMCPLHCHCD